MIPRAPLVAALLFGLAVACAGKSGDTKQPGQACLQKCEQEKCGYVPDNLGDNTEYLECVEGCAEECK